MGVAAILAQNPHRRPATTDRSPAPFVHASNEQTDLDFRAQCRAFVDVKVSITIGALPASARQRRAPSATMSRSQPRYRTTGPAVLPVNPPL
jgi:hypothetical protein